MAGPDVEIVMSMPDASPGAELLEGYFADLVGRQLGRPARAPEVQRALAREPSDDLRPPTGMLWAALVGEVPVGCVGLRLVEMTVGEVTRLWVSPDRRRQGVASALLDEMEATASEWGLEQLRLQAASELNEAMALYGKLGYRAVAAWAESPYSDRWLAKEL